MIEHFHENEQLRNLVQALHAGDSVLIEQLWDAPKALIAALAQQVTGKNILLLTGASQEEGRLYHDLPLFTERAAVPFPAWETLPSEEIPPSPDVVGNRYEVLHQICKGTEPLIILSNLHACLQRLIPKELFQTLYLNITVGQTFAFDTLVEKLMQLGYMRSGVASEKGEFAVRGGIVDIFSVSSPDPYRIEFFADEVESIRLYDPVGQGSIRLQEEVQIPPAQEMELLKKAQKVETILDYLGKETLVIFDEIATLEDRYASLIKETSTLSHTFISASQFLEDCTPFQTVLWSEHPIEELTAVHIPQKTGYYSSKSPLHLLSFEMFGKQMQAKRWVHPFIPLNQLLKPEQEQVQGDDLLKALQHHPDYSVHFLCSTEAEESALQKRLLSFTFPQKPIFHLGYLSSGFALPEDKMILFPSTEITHRYKIRRQKQRSTYHTPPSQAFDLCPGELVVHLNHGIGKYLGIEKRPNHLGIPTEFLLIEYAESSKLFVPVNQAHLVTKYIGAHEEIPKIHTIGSNRWKRAKEKTQQAILGYAKELLQLYAAREIKGGVAYPADTPDMQTFEEEFPYVETEDQLEAIQRIKQDMICEKPMDRLVCGDVGYGKTEVAMRAIFKVAYEGGKQVAILVPTTVLAMQHYDTFQERFSSFPLTIDMLSRYRSTKETKQTLQNISQGSVDIVIGTHRIISGDIQFKDLGLIIIDEEHRFGVRAKEHLKKIRVDVDCLTLSATPIPRTLYMSLIGARDISVINTPPQDRLPITTVIAETNHKTIKNALLRELARDGQAYIIHNRVETIYEYAASIRKLFPQARIAICHGQMAADEIDEVFHAFRQEKIDILVATTIVESGLDIPGANTIIVDRADRFGLADLYQLRGRVGRWNRRAYAYFLVPKMSALSEISRKRLNALANTSGYGGGMKIAMHDLEIRGAGDILGTEQSGHVSLIGFHLYCKLLRRTIKALQGQAPSVTHEVKMEFPTFDARLPEDYVNEVSLRMEIYQRLGEASHLDEVIEIWNELKDRFGPPPEPAVWLYHFTRLRLFAEHNHFTVIKQQKFTLTLQKKQGKEILTKALIWKAPKTPEAFEKSLIKILNEEI